MHPDCPTLRELVIGLGLLRPSDAAEKHAAHPEVHDVPPVPHVLPFERSFGSGSAIGNRHS
jgi:hypothetical protein